MSLPAFIVLTFIVDSVLVLFHLSMFFVVARNVYLKITTFSTAFYRIYLAQSVADYIVYAWSPLFARFQFFNVVPFSAYDANVIGIAQNFISIYGFYFLYFSYVTIAANRYTAILRPFKHEQLWSPERLTVVYVVLGLLPAPLAAIRFWFVYKVVPMDTGYSLSNTAKWPGVVSGYISAVTCIGTCFCTLVLNLHTFYAYRKLSQHNQRTYREEYHLLVYALTHLIGQAVMAVWYVLYYTIISTVPPYMPMILTYVMSLVCLSGPVCLFITSRTTRKAYFKTYFAFNKSSAMFTNRVVTSLT